MDHWVSSALLLKWGVHIGARALLDINLIWFDWLYRSPIPMGRRGDVLLVQMIFYLHCKKSWRSSSTPAYGDAGPKHTGVEQSFRHPWRKFYCKYRTSSVELVRQSRKVSKAACGGRTYDLQDYNLPLYHCATLSYWDEVAKSHYTVSGLTTPCRGSCKCEHLHSVIQW